MNLQLICSTSTVTVYYDTCNNWLFLEWEGELTLQSIKQDCLVIARCFLGRSYPRILNSNVQITSVAWGIDDWLSQNLLPYLQLAGVEQVAWVYASSLRAQEMAEEIAQQLPLEPEVALFADIEQAVTWLQKTASYSSSYPVVPRSAETEALLAKLVEYLSEHLQGTTAG